MEINDEVRQVLRSFNIPIDDGLAYLISVYFDVKPSYTPLALVEKIQRTNILSYDTVTNSILWRVPLFEEQITGFEWLVDWVNMFGEKNKARKGSVKNALPRMKKFFAQNPDIRKDEVIEATAMYLRSVSNPEYIVTSHYFISKGMGADRTSTLYEWVEKYREETKSGNQGRTSLNNTFQ